METMWVVSEQSIVKAFAFDGRAVRVELFDGEPWWVAKDVAVALGYPDSTVSSSMTHLVDKVPDEWKGKKPFLTPGGTQEILCLSEQGLYLFMNRSNMEKAIPFQKWIAGEVLPSIRRTGQYSIVPKDPTVLGLPDFNDPIAAAEGWLIEAKGRREAEAQTKLLAAKVEADAPKVEFAERLEVAREAILIGELAKLITAQVGYRIGQNGLFIWLREHRYIMRTPGRNLLPTQHAVESGWLVIKEGTRVAPSGNVHLTQTTRVTSRGQAHFLGIFARIKAQTEEIGMARLN
jgi:anti-repressor protein